MYDSIVILLQTIEIYMVGEPQKVWKLTTCWIRIWAPFVALREWNMSKLRANVKGHQKCVSH